jgi:hypothetical protein
VEVSCTAKQATTHQMRILDAHGRVLDSEELPPVTKSFEQHGLGPGIFSVTCGLLAARARGQLRSALQRAQAYVEGRVEDAQKPKH